jgi:DNA-binding LacI/PurR family transcriptional regulator
MFSYLGGDKFSREEVEKMAGDVSGVILLSEYDRCTDDFGLNVPAVGVGWHSSMNGRVSVIDLDPFDAAEIAVKYFKQKHAETVNVITVDYPSMLLRADSFANSWERAGGNVKVTISKKLDYKELRFEPGEFYLFSSSWALQTSASAYQQRTGRDLASDASIIGIDGRNLLIPQGIKADTIMPDWKEVGRRAFYECVARIKHPGRSPARIYLPCSLHLAGE